MSRISSHKLIPVVGLAITFALTLTLWFGGVASASSVTRPPQKSFDVTSCLTATPPSQIIGVRHTAWVTVDVNCASIASSSFLQVKWGDGIIEDYPLPVCQQICPSLLPIVVDTSHAYTNTGDYAPLFCLIPSPISITPRCTTVEILVVIQDPPGA